MGKCHLREISRGIFLMADGEAIRFAAEELRRYYERTAGLPLYITDSTESAGFVLAVEPETEKLTDRFQLEEREGRIWICGVNPRSVITAFIIFWRHISISASSARGWNPSPFWRNLCGKSSRLPSQRPFPAEDSIWRRPIPLIWIWQ